MSSPAASLVARFAHIVSPAPTVSIAVTFGAEIVSELSPLVTNAPFGPSVITTFLQPSNLVSASACFVTSPSIPVSSAASPSFGTTTSTKPSQPTSAATGAGVKTTVTPFSFANFAAAKFPEVGSSNCSSKISDSIIVFEWREIYCASPKSFDCGMMMIELSPSVVWTEI